MRNSELFKLAIEKGMKIANIDIENSPDLSWHYGNHDVNVNPIYTEVESQITSMSIKDLNTQETTILEWDRPKDKYGFLKQNRDYKLLRRALPILQSYDILIGQNHIQFDIRKINWRLNRLCLPPLTNLIPIDTMVESRKVFYAPSHSLGYKSHAYGLGGKIKQDFDDCVQVAKGNGAKSVERLIYNAKDTDDDDTVFWKEVDYYRLPKGLINMLKLFIRNNNPTFCIKCAARKDARFDVTRNITKKGTLKFKCNRCEYKWSLEK